MVNIFDRLRIRSIPRAARSRLFPPAKRDRFRTRPVRCRHLPIVAQRSLLCPIAWRKKRSQSAVPREPGQQGPPEPLRDRPGNDIERPAQRLFRAGTCVSTL